MGQYESVVPSVSSFGLSWRLCMLRYLCGIDQNYVLEYE